MLQQTFHNLLARYNIDTATQQALWNEIDKAYSHKKRHYHSLQHLANLLQQLEEVKEKIQQWDAVLFALYYHDMVYNTLRSDNEEKSALLAEERMRITGIPADITAACTTMIRATAAHAQSTDADTNYFTDADLAVLGQDWNTYTAYYQAIRKEYSIYPNLVYNPGRKKVLTHFLQMERIYKTAEFFTKFEQQAKANMQQDLQLLS